MQVDGVTVPYEGDALGLGASEWAGIAKMCVDALTEEGIIGKYHLSSGGKPVRIAIAPVDGLGLRTSEMESKVSGYRYLFLPAFRSALLTSRMVSFQLQVEDDDGLAQSTLARQVPDLVFLFRIGSNESNIGRTTRREHLVSMSLVDQESHALLFEKLISFPKALSRGVFGR
jgi:hypothetical protein